jgi:uncharacterized protein (TIGR03382 family)
MLLCAPRAEAFCGFYVGGAGEKLYNHATQVVLMRSGTTTVLSMQNNYEGPPEQFALVVPVPVVLQKDQVKTLPRELFSKVDLLGAPRLVEYWERDPCYKPHRHHRRFDDDDDDKSSPKKKDSKKRDDDDDGERAERVYHVKIEARFAVAEYEIVVLSSTESTGLERWLRDNRYAIPDGAAALLRPYVEQGTKFFVAKVDPTKVKFENGMATLSPLRFHYDSPDFALPIRLGLANSPGAQDLIVNILAPGTRYEVTNYPNVTIPTNLVVHDDVRTRFGEFYAALFDHAVEAMPGAVVTEYAWDAQSCDPCPGPVLDERDLLTLGADVLPRGADRRFTLTRLHARYGPDVSSDLVFAASDPIEGGRGVPDRHGALGVTVDHSGGNTFQGRYVILHPWARDVTCEDPNRGVWGGPSHTEIAAKSKDVAFAPRGRIELASLVDGPLPPGATLRAGSPSAPTLALPRPMHPQGCGCESSGATSAGAIAVLAVVLRRRRRV